MDAIWQWPTDRVHHLAGSAGRLTFVGGAGDFDAAGRIRNPDNLEAQVAGAMANAAEALAAESCTLADIVRVKAYYAAEVEDWQVIAAIAAHLADDPMPAISTVPEPLQPFAGQVVQLQIIAERGWRAMADIRVAERPVPPPWQARLGARKVTGGLRAGERFLVHGGSSGIGTTAIQLAHAFGARVFATAGSDEKCAACVHLGAEAAFNYREEDFVAEMLVEGGADLILDMVGGEYIPRNLKALAEDGRLVQIAFLQGPKVEVNFATLMTRRLTMTGSTLRPQSDLAKARIAQALREAVWPMIEAGKVAPVMDQEFDLEDAGKAHERMESSVHIGKIVLKVG